MKNLFFVFAGLVLSVFSAVAQTNHPSIEKTEVMYVPVPAAPGPADSNSSPEIRVRGTVAIALKSSFDVAKISLTVMDEQTMAILYHVNYTVSSADVTDHGIVLYKKEGDALYITNPAILPLKPYIYVLYTETISGTQSPNYSIIQ